VASLITSNITKVFLEVLKYFIYYCFSYFNSRYVKATRLECGLVEGVQGIGNK